MAAPSRSPHGFFLGGPSSAFDEDFEAAELKLFKGLLSDADICLDVGANVGLYACVAAARGIAVMAFEPSGENLQLLLNNLVHNNFTSVEVFPLALGDRPGVAKLYGGGTGASVLKGWAGTPSNWSSYVAVHSLDLIAFERIKGKRALIKIDVEGHELAVLKGAQHILQSTPAPIVLIEISLSEHHPDGSNPKFEATFDLLWKLGYRASPVKDLECEITPRHLNLWLADRTTGGYGHNFIFRKNLPTKP